MHFDVLITGAGPAGCTAALNLAGSGLKIALVDKSVLPGHKVCGDALSGTVMNVLKQLPCDCYNDFLKLPGIQGTNGIRFVAPNNNRMDIPYSTGKDPAAPPAGFLCKRIDFDGFLLDKIRNFNNIAVFENTKITGLEPVEEAIRISAGTAEFSASMIIGADGIDSVVRQFIHTGKLKSRAFTCLGVRAYYKNVRDLHPDHFLELHFLRELLPEYLWIFPMRDGIANVGLGMMPAKMRKRKIVPGKMMEDILFNDPAFAYRFAPSTRIGRIEAHGLPYGSGRIRISAGRMLLAGDAASLVNPFTGEGIGNAMISGMVASEMTIEAFSKQDFSAEFLKIYDKRIEGKTGQDLRISRMIRNLARYPRLVNFVVNKVNRSPELTDLFTKMYSSMEVKSKLVNPVFYLRLLFS